MAKVTKYRNIVQGEMAEWAARNAINMPKVERQLIVDAQQSHFVLISVGWQGSQYIHQCLVHIQIQGDKIWIHEDRTDPGIYESLLGKGIPAADMILGYTSEIERSAASPYRDIAV